MMRMTIEIIPFDGSPKRGIALVDIGNVSGMAEEASYEYEARLDDGTHKGRVEGHCRSEGAVALGLKVLSDLQQRIEDATKRSPSVSDDQESHEAKQPKKAQPISSETPAEAREVGAGVAAPSGDRPANDGTSGVSVPVVAVDPTSEGQNYACVACTEPRSTYGMCTRCSNAWGIGRREALQAAYHVANGKGASREVTDAIIAIAQRSSPVEPMPAAPTSEGTIGLDLDTVVKAAKEISDNAMYHPNDGWSLDRKWIDDMRIALRPVCRDKGAWRPRPAVIATSHTDETKR